MNAYPRTNVLYVAIHGLHQLSGKNAYAGAPYFKVSIVGEEDTKETTAVGKLNAHRDAFTWTDVLQFPFTSNRPPTELLLTVKRNGLMSKNRTIAKAKVPLYRLGDLPQFRVQQGVLDSKRRKIGIVDLTVRIGDAQTCLHRMDTLPYLQSSFPHMHTSPYLHEDTVSPVAGARSPTSKFLGRDDSLGNTLSSSNSGHTIVAMDSQGHQFSRQLTMNTTGVFGQFPGGYRTLMPLATRPGPMTQIVKRTPSTRTSERNSGSCERYPSIVDDGSLHL